MQNAECKIQNPEYRIQNTDTHVHKMTNVPVFLYDFDAGKYINWAIGRGGGLVMDGACIKIITSCAI
jgi:hypothetical protein